MSNYINPAKPGITARTIEFTTNMSPLARHVLACYKDATGQSWNKALEELILTHPRTRGMSLLRNARLSA